MSPFAIVFLILIGVPFLWILLRFSLAVLCPACPSCGSRRCEQLDTEWGSLTRFHWRCECGTEFTVECNG